MLCVLNRTDVKIGMFGNLASVRERTVRRAVKASHCSKFYVILELISLLQSMWFGEGILWHFSPPNPFLSNEIC